MRFAIIVPVYNGEKYLKKCIDSILSQTYKEFGLFLIDDCSTDNSAKIIKEYNDKRIKLIRAEIKLYNGGARNVGIEFAKANNYDYILFLDNDDWFDDNKCLETIKDIINENKYPDCVSLSYYCLIDGNKQLVELERNTPEELVNSLFIAPWTKCIKTELMQPFPNNTLMEDMSQHIKQCDVLETIVSCKKPIVVWNRENGNSCSLNPSEKRKSSEFRQIADVMDLELTHDYCIKHKQWRIESMINAIKDGRHLY